MDTLSYNQQLIEKKKKQPNIKTTAPGEVNNFINSKAYGDIMIYAKQKYVPKMDKIDKYFFVTTPAYMHSTSYRHRNKRNVFLRC